jgi:hypothetical protein
MHMRDMDSGTTDLFWCHSAAELCGWVTEAKSASFLGETQIPNQWLLEIVTTIPQGPVPVDTFAPGDAKGRCWSVPGFGVVEQVLASFGKCGLRIVTILPAAQPGNIGNDGFASALQMGRRLPN